MSLWEEMRKWLKESTKAAYEETKVLTQKGKIKFDIFTLNRRLQNKFAELGERVYELSRKKEGKEKIIQDKRITTLLKEIGKIERELKKKKKESDEIK